MMLVCLWSVGGSPGVTTWGLLLATALRTGTERVFLEADVSGGVLTSRYGLPLEPGAAELISDSRRGGTGPPEVAGCGSQLSAGLWCVPAPPGPDRSWPLWAGGSEMVTRRLTAVPELWLADCGRVWPGQPTSELLAGADAHIAFLRAGADAALAMRPAIERLTATAPIGAVAVGRGGPSRRELAAFLGVEHLWTVPDVDNLCAVPPRVLRSKRARRSIGWRAAVELAAAIDGWLPTPDRPVPPMPPPSAYLSGERR